jgi:CRP/FNR family cyclic AMP-dependent transcriptional regulator
MSVAYPLQADTCRDCTVREQRPFCNAVMTHDALERSAWPAPHPRGAILFGEGERPRGVFVLCSGRAKLTATTSEGRSLIARIADAGEVLGLSAVILGTPYEMTCEIIDTADVTFIRREELMSIIGQDPMAAMQAATQLSTIYDSAQRELRSLALSRTSGERLARLLLDWADRRGERSPDGIRVHVPFTHDELSQMIGTTRETVTRLFSAFRRKKLVTVKGSTIVLREQALRDMVA